MRRQDTIRLDTHALVRRFEACGLKQWWVAEQLGVNRKTVSRWLTGKVQRVDRCNAEALAALLDCPLENLLRTDATDVFATREEQRRAAVLLQQRDLLQLLSPSDDWELAERLVKATMQPDLPLSDLGRLHNLLCIAAWRQSHYAEADEHAREAMALGERVGDAALQGKAWANVGTIAWFQQSYEPAVAAFERALGLGFDRPRDRASALFNLGFITRSLGRLVESLVLQRRSIALFEQGDHAFNLAISWTGVALTQIELGEWSEASAAVARARTYAQRCGYERGLAQLLVYEADLDALSQRGSGDVVEALARLSAFAQYDVSVHECAARILRIAGEHGQAVEQLQNVYDRLPERSFGVATALQEESRIAWASGDRDGAHRLAAVANRLLAELGMPLRVRSAPLPEMGRMFSGCEPPAAP